MGRPKKEKYEIEERFTTAAFQLAESYSVLLTDRQYHEDLMSGNFKYTEDMAIQDLIGGGQQEGERVQTSNISNIPERVGILLADGYVEKHKRQMQREARENRKEYLAICEKIGIVEAAMQERMDARTRAVFRCLYIEHRPWSKVKDEIGNRLHPQQISTAQQSAIYAIAEELVSVEYLKRKEEQDGTQEENHSGAV